MTTEELHVVEVLMKLEQCELYPGDRHGQCRYCLETQNLEVMYMYTDPTIQVQVHYYLFVCKNHIVQIQNPAYTLLRR